MTTMAEVGQWLLASAIVVASVGCQTSHQWADAATVDAMVAICNGVSGVRLRAFEEPMNVRELRGSIVRVENGYPSLMIDGACDFWIGGGWIDDPQARDLGWRRGHLDAALELELRQVLPVDNLGVLQKCVNTGGADISTRSFRSPTSRASCIEGGPRFEAAWSWLQTHAADLWNNAVPLSGGIRVEAVLPSGGDDSKAYPWPAGAALSGLVLPSINGLGDMEFTSGVSTAVTEPSRAEALRMLRDEYVADRRAAPGLFYDGQKMMDQNTTATVYMRDLLPYEDAKGLLPFSDPSAPQAP